jgi:Mg-chelatase subunit ChlD
VVGPILAALAVVSDGRPLGELDRRIDKTRMKIETLSTLREPSVVVRTRGHGAGLADREEMSRELNAQLKRLTQARERAVQRETAWRAARP